MKRLLGSLGLLAASTLVALGLGEAALRMFGTRFDASLYGGDNVTGWRLRPNASGWVVSEGHAYVTINSAGMHDRKYPFAKPRDTVRIAVLGDSMTAALQVEVERNFCRVLERRLSDCGRFHGKTVEVMNFGVPGFGTAQELLTFREGAIKYAPDIVILAFFTYNDIQNNHKALNPVDADKAPYFVFENGALVLDRSALDNRSRAYERVRDRLGDMANRSRVVQLGAEVLIRRGAFEQVKHQQASALTSAFGEMPENLVYAPPEHSEIKEAWHVTEELILMLQDEVRRIGSSFWLVTLSQDPQHLPKPQREAAVRAQGIHDLYYPDRRLEEFARRHGMPAIVLVDRMAEIADRRWTRLTFEDGHYNEAGHEAAGSLIAERLCQES